MPLNNSQLAALVERARLRPSPAVAPAPSRRSLSDKPPKPSPEPAEQPTQPTPGAPPPRHSPETASPLPTATTSDDDFPTGWELKKESWHFHRRFYAVFKRPMKHGEYSHLLHQIRFGRAEHLWEDWWRVSLPGGRTLPIRATRWRLIIILPKHWQPPADIEPSLVRDSGSAAASTLDVSSLPT
jgi:hypothetical protein